LSTLNIGFSQNVKSYLKHIFLLSRLTTVNNNKGSIVSKPIFLEYKLNHECSTFKGAMKANAADAMQKPIMVNPLTQLWKTLSTSNILRKYFGEWFKVVEIATFQVLGYVEDEQTFFVVSFTKNKL